MESASALPDPSLDDARAIFARRPGAAPLHVEAMPGGASTRRYFRVRYDDGAAWVGMFVPERGKAEEIQKGSHGERWPFLEVRDLLASYGVRVPTIHAEYTDEGWVLLEDLGDDTLANYLLAHPESREALYRGAVTDLAHAQARLSDLPADSIVRSRAFDADLLEWEVEHFYEWGVVARGFTMTDVDRAEFQRIGRALSERIAGLDYGFTHRDYQSRNLMVKSHALVWIDFQDALLGPRVYDLVALLNDSYQVFDRAFVEARLHEFASARGIPAGDVPTLVREFDLVTVQRKLKDAGRFVFIDRVKKNPNFLRFVEPTVQKVRGALERLRGDAGETDLAALDQILARTLGASYR